MVTAVLITAAAATSGQSVVAGPPDMDQELREGQVVSLDMIADTITVREYGGRNTYQLSPTGRQDVEREHIMPGDRVRFRVYGVWGVAYQFWRL
jgi:hypothetical protein